MVALPWLGKNLLVGIIPLGLAAVTWLLRSLQLEERLLMLVAIVAPGIAAELLDGLGQRPAQPVQEELQRRHG